MRWFVGGALIGACITNTAGVEGIRPTLVSLKGPGIGDEAVFEAAVMRVIGGIANAELREDQVPIVTGLPGIVATTTDSWPAVYGSAEFLRAWSEQPGFRPENGLISSRPGLAVVLVGASNGW